MKEDVQKFKLFADANFTVAENPLWNEREQCLYWKGWQAGRLYRKRPGSAPKDFETFRLPVGKIGGFVFTDDGALLVFAQQGRVWSWRPGETPLKIAELPGADAKTYFNDLVADPEGRIFVGTLSHDFYRKIRARNAKWEKGALWRFDPDGTFQCVERDTGSCPNGMAFSRDVKSFYFSVTDERTVYRYDYDRASGGIGTKTPFVDCPCCDGITVDAEDCLWSAQAGGVLARYSPSGKLLLKLQLPVRGVSSLTFGGRDYQTIFATAMDHPKGSDNALGAGGVLLLRQDIKGVPEFLASRKDFTRTGGGSRSSNGSCSPPSP